MADAMFCNYEIGFHVFVREIKIIEAKRHKEAQTKPRQANKPLKVIFKKIKT